ncbi:hypothetical protein DFP72DRAFT_1163571 [Ephemerocybe angulata]|uniref:F-box domain-containing protein n=1 Tax=Ephemerocybe angulata TaxID=980116 RepID=A0A8H6IGW2_9AGAR|nr:hypothetical protein DFP72DRAFT_1163571 [Tulosesus angulatus]
MYPLRVTVIPDDILAELFLACLPCVEEGWPTEAAGGHEKRWETVGQNRHPSVDLSHVCRRWRRVALGTPRLWVQADICIPSFPDSKDRIRRLTQLVEAMTRRSAACTMSFKVKVAWEDRGFKWTVPTGILAPFKKLFQEFVDAVCASSARWRCFSLSGDFDGEAHGDAVIKFLDAIAGPLPALSYVFIDAEFASQRHPTRIIRPLIAAPALQSVAILQPYGLLKDLPVAAWSHLKNLTLGSWKRASGKGIQNIGMHSHTALCLLKSLRSLVHLDMHMDHVAPNEAEEYSLANITVEPVFLPHLQSLSLKGAAVAPGFATAVTLPSLEVLRFTSLRIMDRERQEAGLLECVSCFGCTITGFELDVVDFSEAFVVACAESLMQITTLTIGELPPRRRKGENLHSISLQTAYWFLFFDILHRQSSTRSPTSIPGDIEPPISKISPFHGKPVPEDWSKR